jgi:phosphoglycolate phosphatase-like HAD superfamily hydrolase
LTVRAVAIDLDGALGDTHGLWLAFLADASRRFRSIAELDPAAVPADRGEAADTLDRWASNGVGDWRAALERFAEDHAPVHLRPSAEAGACVRALAAGGARLGVYTDAPEELARVALSHLGVDRRIEALETGRGSLDRLVEQFGGSDVSVARTLGELRLLTR